MSGLGGPRFWGPVWCLTVLLALTVPAAAADSEWIRQFGTGGLDEAKAVALDPAGNAYVVGETFGTLPGQTPGGTLDAFVAKFGPTGDELWTRQFGAWDRDIAWGIAVDPRGFAYVVGQTEGTLPGQRSAGGWDGFIRAYDLSGAEVWTRQFGGGGADVALGAALDDAGKVYVAGTTSSVLSNEVQAGSFDAFVRCYDSAGQVVWTRQFGTPGADTARRAAIDPWGRLLVAGSTEAALPGQVSAGGFDAFVSMFDPDGTELWTRQFGGAGHDFGLAVATDPTGRISVAGSADQAFPGETSPGGTTAFLRLFDVDGSTLWTHQFGSGIADEAWDVTIDAGGNTTLVGTTARVLPGQRSAGGTDAFVRTYDRRGHETWTFQYGTTEDDSALAVALLDRPDGIVIAGGSRGALGDRSAGELDAYVMRLVRRAPR